MPHIASNAAGLPTPSSVGFELPAAENPPSAVANIASGQNVVQTTPPIVQVESTDIPETGENSTNQQSQETTNDVVMGDAANSDMPALKPQDDKNLPPWLAAMIKYLRAVTDEAAWQNLVTDFVDFEKGGPPNGVSPFKLLFLGN